MMVFVLIFNNVMTDMKWTLQKNEMIYQFVRWMKVDGLNVLEAELLGVVVGPGEEVELIGFGRALVFVGAVDAFTEFLEHVVHWVGRDRRGTLGVVLERAASDHIQSSANQVNSTF